MKRIDFIKRITTVAVIGLPVVAMTGSCTASVEPLPNPPLPATDANCLENGTNSSIAANHGHTLTVSKSDVANGVEKTYAIQGSASHNHEVTVTADNFATLKNNSSIQFVSTASSGHTHSVTVSCV